MGLAASQARFLQLTARRSNIEYQGQQINQQRLALANESSGLYQRQLSLVVPTPPSSSDSKYTTAAYDYTDPTDNIQKNISFTFDAAQTQITGYKITYNKYDPSGNSITVTQKSTDTNPALIVTSLTFTASTGTVSSGSAMQTGKTYISYTNNGDSYIDATSGRVSHIILATVSTNGTKANIEKSGQVGLTYSPTFDTQSYNDDMNKYEYQKATYDYEIERINAETSRIQEQDKSLELKMKQLDTEHTAVQTEMDAVQKVIQNNVSSSFKTFSS